RDPAQPALDLLEGPADGKGLELVEREAVQRVDDRRAAEAVRGDPSEDARPRVDTPSASHSLQSHDIEPRRFRPAEEASVRGGDDRAREAAGVERERLAECDAAGAVR